MTPAPQLQPSIDYDQRTHRFVARVNGTVLSRDARSYEEAEALIAHHEQMQQVARLVELPPEREAYSVEEVAQALGVSAGLVYGLVNDKTITSFRVGRLVRISAGALRRYIKDQERGDDAPPPRRPSNVSLLAPRRYNRRTST